MQPIRTQLVASHPRLRARALVLTTPHGEVQTPCFMPVATRAVVHSLTVDELHTTKASMILGGNTFHMLGSPGMDRLRALGGMHRFMGWDGPMLTDSGGFQVFSLSQDPTHPLARIDEDGATFRHPESGAEIRMTPESSIGAQKVIGADVIMAFDQCTPDAGGREAAEQAMERTHRWLTRSIAVHHADPLSITGLPQALFGIVQGGVFRDLREQSAHFIAGQELDGIAFGGESIGGDMEKTAEILDWVVPLLPQEKPRYTMGVGLRPQNLLDVVARGADMFDCVAPTRNARHGRLYTGRVVPDGDWLKVESDEPNGELNLSNAQFAEDARPIDPSCDCTTCARYSRAYLRFLMKAKAPVYFHLACTHNVRAMVRTCEAMRDLLVSAD